MCGTPQPTDRPDGPKGSNGDLRPCPNNKLAACLTSSPFEKRMPAAKPGLTDFEVLDSSGSCSEKPGIRYLPGFRHLLALSGAGAGDANPQFLHAGLKGRSLQAETSRRAVGTRDNPVALLQRGKNLVPLRLFQRLADSAGAA